LGALQTVVLDEADLLLEVATPTLLPLDQPDDVQDRVAATHIETLLQQAQDTSRHNSFARSRVSPRCSGPYEMLIMCRHRFVYVSATLTPEVAALSARLAREPPALICPTEVSPSLARMGSCHLDLPRPKRHPTCPITVATCPQGSVATEAYALPSTLRHIAIPTRLHATDKEVGSLCIFQLSHGARPWPLRPTQISSVTVCRLRML
jgi:hypothetical protein